MSHVISCSGAVIMNWKIDACESVDDRRSNAEPASSQRQGSAAFLTSDRFAAFGTYRAASLPCLDRLTSSSQPCFTMTKMNGR